MSCCGLLWVVSRSNWTVDHFKSALPLPTTRILRERSVVKSSVWWLLLSLSAAAAVSAAAVLCCVLLSIVCCCRALSLLSAVCSAKYDELFVVSSILLNRDIYIYIYNKI